MEELAERVADALREKYGEETLVGVSYYHEDGVGHVYRSEWAAEKYDPEEVDEIVQDLRFEALGHGAHEQRHREGLHATVRVYDELIDVVVPITEFEGLAFALSNDGEYTVRNVVSLVETVVEESDVERTALDHPSGE
ncbi:hypothetical protein [Halospeciosus flavus]|uniref:Uncharacterized protein n=1 Tax=Halospeciosus flavus TaxID=3032283 RepID=A0ABD5Z556_9EURY|nr:hypothetical protein [Halospeciosus flavus]